MDASAAPLARTAAIVGPSIVPSATSARSSRVVFALHGVLEQVVDVRERWRGLRGRLTKSTEPTTWGRATARMAVPATGRAYRAEATSGLSKTSPRPTKGATCTSVVTPAVFAS